MANSAQDRITVIRPTIRADIPAVKAIIDANDLFPSDMLEEMMASYFNGEASNDFWLTTDANGPVAIAYYAPERMTQGTWNLYVIAVHPGRQGEGHGTALLRHVEDVLTACGERVLLVETSGLSEFARTRAFYHARGYDEEARIREFYQKGEDKVIFRKALGKSQ